METTLRTLANILLWMAVGVFGHVLVTKQGHTDALLLVQTFCLLSLSFTGVWFIYTKDKS